VKSPAGSGHTSTGTGITSPSSVVGSRTSALRVRWPNSKAGFQFIERG
jgi:hypothetical protein